MAWCVGSAFIAAARAREGDMDVEERRRALRAQYPELAGIADRLREVFPGASVKYVGPARPDSLRAVGLTPPATPSEPTQDAASASQSR